MGTQTENYKLIQPSPEDYNIFKDHNENMDIIDSQLKKLEREKEALIKKKSAFNKDFEVDAEKIAMNGTADVGVSDSIARGDHVHPTDTTRAAALHKHDGVYDTPDGVQKKIDAHASQAEPHAGHISHSLATAPNDFLVSSQAGRFVKKTVDEVKGILGFGTAAYTNATNFASAEQGTRADNALPATAYTASDVLEKLMTVDGNASGLNADLLDGKEATAFATAEQGVKADNALPATAYTASDVLEKLMTVDGEKSVTVKQNWASFGKQLSPTFLLKNMFPVSKSPTLIRRAQMSIRTEFPSGKVPTTLVRRLISRLIRSTRFVVRILDQCS